MIYEVVNPKLYVLENPQRVDFWLVAVLAGMIVTGAVGDVYLSMII
jgi:hypothetical protein